MSYRSKIEYTYKVISNIDSKEFPIPPDTYKERSDFFLNFQK